VAARSPAAAVAPVDILATEEMADIITVQEQHLVLHPEQAEEEEAVPLPILVRIYPQAEA
jgi:hypothetical protein